MAFIISDMGNDKPRFKMPDPGTYVGRCIRLEDLGTQESVWEGETKSSRKVRLAFELPTELVEWEKDGAKVKEPFIVFSTMTMSMGEKATLRKTLESWRGRQFAPEEVKAFDLSSILGKPAMVSLSASKDGKYVNITTVSSLAKGMVCPDQVLPGWMFHLSEPDWNVFPKIGKGTRMKIEASPEFKALTLPPEIAALVLTDKAEASRG